MNRFIPIRLKHYHGEGKADQLGAGADTHKPRDFKHAGSRYTYFNPHLKYLRRVVARAARHYRAKLNPRTVHVEHVVNNVAVGRVFHRLPCQRSFRQCFMHIYIAPLGVRLPNQPPWYCSSVWVFISIHHFAELTRKDASYVKCICN